MGLDEILHRYVHEHERQMILAETRVEITPIICIPMDSIRSCNIIEQYTESFYN